MFSETDFDFEYFSLLRGRSPEWRLLRADSAPLIMSFFNRVFIETGMREIRESDLAEKLEDELFSLRERCGDDMFPRSALDYLYEWAEPDKGWLRRFYGPDGDEPYFDLMPSLEKTILWLKSLEQGTFVGTESRLKIIFELLRQITEGAENDAGRKIEALERRRDEITAEIERIKRGASSTLDDTAVRDRFQQFAVMARELLSDFRTVEYNLRTLDRDIRKRIALSTAAKGAILDDVLGRSDSIEDSDQGRSFIAFMEFLLSKSRQDEMHAMMDKIFRMKAVTETNHDPRLARISDRWLDASDHTLATMRRLSAQLRQFLDGSVWLENRRIIELLQSISRSAVSLDIPYDAPFTEIDVPGVEIDLAMERPLFTLSERNGLDSANIVLADEAEPADSFFDIFYVDRERLEENIRLSLIDRSQATLAEITEKFPIALGLAEVVTYMGIAAESPNAFIDEEAEEYIIWETECGAAKRVVMPRIIFTRETDGGGLHL